MDHGHYDGQGQAEDRCDDPQLSLAGEPAISVHIPLLLTPKQTPPNDGHLCGISVTQLALSA